METAPMQGTRQATILIAENDAEAGTYFQSALQSFGYSVELALERSAALSSLRTCGKAVDAVLLDVTSDEWNGLDALRNIRQYDPNLPVIVLSTVTSNENIVRAVKMGATDVLCKPVACERLTASVYRAVEQHSTTPDARGVRPEPSGIFFGNSSGIRRIQALIAKIGWSDAPVLILGETGAGKEVIARELHARSARSSKQFLKLNCAALPPELIESELFGYERGAFTGALQRKTGMFENADGGTLLLDEIGDMDFRLQSKLLHVLQDNSFIRVGGKDAIHVDVRVMAATHRDLEQAIVNQRFREDLFYRLNVINIHLPPLRERSEDILGLAEFLIDKHSTRGVAAPRLTLALKQAMMTYHWPGNIRELENCIRRLFIFREPDLIAGELKSKSNYSVRVDPRYELPHMPVGTSVLDKIVDERQQAEIDVIVSALDSSSWDRQRAAALLNVEYSVLMSRIRKLRIRRKPRPAGAAAAAASNSAGHGQG